MFLASRPSRYEIEYDENRLEIGWDIGRRFLGIECEHNAINNTRCDTNAVKDSHDDVVLQFADNDDHSNYERQNSTDANAQETTATATATATTTTTATTNTTKPVSNTTNYSTTSSNKLSKDENVNAANLSNDADNVVSSKSSHANDNNKDTSKETNLNCEKDELVLDVLNDDLIEKVRGKISCKF